MGLFDGKSKEEKQAEKLQRVLDKYELNNLPLEYANAVRAISQEIAGSNIMELGQALSFSTKSEDTLKINYLHAIMEQNWIIIRLLNQIANK